MQSGKRDVGLCWGGRLRPPWGRAGKKGRKAATPAGSPGTVVPARVKKKQGRRAAGQPRSRLRPRKGKEKHTLMKKRNSKSSKKKKERDRRATRILSIIKSYAR